MIRNPRRRRACLIGGALLLLLGALAALAAHWIPQRLEGALVAAMQARDQRTLQFDAAPVLELLPQPGIRLGGVRLTERGGAAPFAAFASARVHIALLPLLRREVVVERIEVAGLQATLVRRADGTLNVDDLLRPDPDSRVALRLGQADVRIALTQVEYRDEGSGRALRLRDALIEARAADAGRRRFEIGGRVESAAPGATFTLRAAVESLPAPGTADLALERAEIEIGGTLGGWPGVDARLTAAAVRWHAAAAELEADAAEFSARSANGVEFRLAATRVVADAARVSAPGISATLGYRSGGFEAQAALQTPLAMRLGAGLIDLPGLSGTLALALPGTPPRRLTLPLSGSVQADLKRQTATADLAARLDDSRARVRLTAAHFAPLDLRVAADIDRLDLDRYLPSPPERPEARRAPADLSVLTAVGVRGVIAIGRLRANKIDARDVRLDF